MVSTQPTNPTPKFIRTHGLVSWLTEFSHIRTTGKLWPLLLPFKWSNYSLNIKKINQIFVEKVWKNTYDLWRQYSREKKN